MISWFFLAAALTAQPAAQTVAVHDIEDRVGAMLMERLAATQSKAMVHLDAGLRPQTVPAGTLDIEVGEPIGRFPRSHVAVPVRLRVDGRTARTLTVWAELHEPRMALTYSRDYRRAQVAESVSATAHMVDATCCAGPLVMSMDAVKGMRIRKDVHEGAPVQLADFEALPDVASQQRVAVEVIKGAVALNVDGVAMRDGHLGDRVAVRLPMATRLVDATVIGPNRVRVNE
ncbi:flagellar basal body P-ring formation chaperone FlgA [Solilutibacter silvestris]|uniref:flagellar basal body P-ring formation chaperone FlgA n=1 Tax=Solilutibacter silvestris TaxID=1645665 RepID=UPI003D34DBFE